MKLLFFLIVFAMMGMHHRLATADEDKQMIQTNWKPCSDELMVAHIAQDIQVYTPKCPAVNGSETRCVLKKGDKVTLIVKFKPKVSVSNLERVIIARVPAALDKKVEVPYGPPISPCVNSSLTATDATECFNEGVEADKQYTYTSSFDVLQSFPAVEDLETRFILRQRNAAHKKLRLYKKHPGPTVYCVLVPHIYVQD